MVAEGIINNDTSEFLKLLTKYKRHLKAEGVITREKEYVGSYQSDPAVVMFTKMPRGILLVALKALENQENFEKCATILTLMKKYNESEKVFLPLSLETYLK